MTGEKTLPGCSTECFSSALGDFHFGAADIGDESARRQHRTKALDVIENRQHRRSQHHQIAATYRIAGLTCPYRLRPDHARVPARVPDRIRQCVQRGDVSSVQDPATRRSSLCRR